MSDVSQHDGDHGGVRAPAAPAGLTATPDADEHQDYWDRPEGDWGPAETAPPADEATWWDDRAQANTLYVLGSRALRRGELKQAAYWLGRAAEHEHPGALFRLAVIASRILGTRGTRGTDRTVFLISEAARCGHADARYLMRRRLGLPPGREKPGGQDPEFYAELADALGYRDTAPVTSWSPQVLRAPSLTDTSQQQLQGLRPTRRWDSVQRVLEVLDLVGDAGRSVSAEYLRIKTSLPHTVIERLLVWLCGKGFLTKVTDGGYTPGPALQLLAHEAVHGPGPSGMRPTGAPGPGKTIRMLLAALRDAAGAAVYIGTYIDGEIRIDQCADSPTTPKVNEWVDFRSAAHATAVGKSLLQQLDFDQRMDHLTRHRPERLTSRTITNHTDLFRALDGHGPHAAQFDLLEHSTKEICVAVPIGIGGEAGCVALSLPVGQRHRLLEAARILSSRSASLLVSLLLTANPPRLETGRQATAPHPQHSATALSGISMADSPVPAGIVLPVARRRKQSSPDVEVGDTRDYLPAPIPAVAPADDQSTDMWRELEDLFTLDWAQPDVILPDTPEALNRRHVDRAGTAIG
ncbi:IclR family transcriptional regulator C-terminal domain-containing protein [Streptomyces sp. NPDC046374]|uniref:IclR family transcriptional regulator domain-containing protein n=1 Tax=Streptomyces sp. NPDC046374 TaxID=3154917 RepID=UPI0033E5188E